MTSRMLNKLVHYLEAFFFFFSVLEIANIEVMLKMKMAYSYFASLLKFGHK